MLKNSNVSRENEKIGFQIIYLILSYAAWGVFWGAWGILLPAVKAATGATDAMLGTALVGITIGAIPAMLGTGIIIKQFSKWVLFFGLIFFAASISAITLVTSPLNLAIVLFFIGSSSGMIDVIMNSGVATLESLTGKHYFNYAHAAFPVAVIITSPLVGVARQIGIDINLIILVIAAIVAFAGLLGLRLEIPNKVQENIEDNKDKPRSRKLLLTKSIMIFGLIGLLVHLMENAVEQWSAIYLEEKLFSTPAIASLGLTGYMAMLFIGRIIAQKLSNLWSDKRILITSAIISVIGFFLAAMTSNSVIAIIGFAIAGLGIAPIVPMILSLTGRNISDDKRVSAISSVTVIAYTGYLISPPFIGYISAIFSLKTAWFTLTGMGVLLATIIYIFTGERIKKS
jgi:fucose permease